MEVDGSTRVPKAVLIVAIWFFGCWMWALARDLWFPGDKNEYVEEDRKFNRKP